MELILNDPKHTKIRNKNLAFRNNYLNNNNIEGLKNNNKYEEKSWFLDPIPKENMKEFSLYQCEICYEFHDDENYYFFPCFHKICLNCFDKFINSQCELTCPFCRNDTGEDLNNYQLDGEEQHLISNDNFNQVLFNQNEELVIQNVEQENSICDRLFVCCNISCLISMIIVLIIIIA